MYLYLVFNKSAYRSLLYIDIISFLKTIFDFYGFMAHSGTVPFVLLVVERSYPALSTCPKWKAGSTWPGLQHSSTQYSPGMNSYTMVIGLTAYVPSLRIFGFNTLHFIV